MDASINGIPFRIDPVSFSFNYRVKVAKRMTLGGMVVQVFGTDVGPLTVAGSFGIGGWPEQRAFLDRMKGIADSQVSIATSPGNASVVPPIRFLWPSQGLDFQVQLLDYKQPGSQDSIEIANDIVAPSWQLSLHIVEDNGTLSVVAQDLFISRLAQDFGWERTTFSGPLGADDVQAFLAGFGVSTIGDYVAGLGVNQIGAAGDFFADVGGGATPV